MVKLDNAFNGLRQDMRSLLYSVLQETNIANFLDHAQREIIEETASKETLEKLAGITLVHIHYKTELNRKFQNIQEPKTTYAA
jgi:hypothetical protein